MPRLKVSRSALHGRGVYAAEEIGKGVKVIEYVGKRVSAREAERVAEEQLCRSSKSGTGAVYLFTINKKYDIDGNVPWNKARLINHSCDPNCEAQNIRGHIWIVSKRKIKTGEELTYNYGFGMDSWQDHKCRCGSPKRLGYIVAASSRGALSRVLKRRRV